MYVLQSSDPARTVRHRNRDAWERTLKERCHDHDRDHLRHPKQAPRTKGRGGPIALIGVISDTHGLLRIEALEALRGVESIVHAGDVGDPSILEALRRVAPVTAVRGNVDRGALARNLPATAILESGGASIYVLHDLSDLDMNPRVAGFRVVVSGHTHVPVAREDDGVLYLNPGSAGPRRFHLPVSVAILTVEDGAASAAIVELPIG